MTEFNGGMIIFLGGRQVDEEELRLQNRCPCVVHCPPNEREPRGKLYLP